MRVIERAPATGAYFALQAALAGHVGVSEEAAAFARQSFDPPPRFATMARLSRAYLLTCAGLPEDAATSYRQAGPLETWSLPAFFILPGYVYAALACAGIGRHDDLAVLHERLEEFRGEHVVGNGVAFMGPVELALGRAAAVLGRLDAAIADLTTAISRLIPRVRQGSWSRRSTTSRRRCSNGTARVIASRLEPSARTPIARRGRSA